jgi:uncharacterized membrane protein
MRRVALNIIFCIQILLLFLFFAGDRIELPAWMQVAGRLHPLVLHLPIGFLIFLTIMFFFRSQLEKNSFHRMVGIGLLITSFFASIAALFGFFLSLQDDYGTDALTQHKVTGILLSWFCYLLVLLHNAGGRIKLVYGLGGVTVLILIVVGHTGAVLTHGQNFVFAPISTQEELTADNASVYEFAVRPILDRKCFSCHNETKAKGGFVMTSIDKFKEGGKNGKAFVEGNPRESRMVKAFYLPLSHDEHMPPDGKPQLTPVEISTIEAWISSGADFDKKLNQFADGDSLKFIVASFAATNAEVAVDEKRYTFPAASSAVIEELNTPFRSVFPLYRESPALQADFFLKESFKPEFLSELKRVADQLVVLNLSKMPVNNNDLSVISSFTNLENLNLNFTAIDGKGLASLTGLKNLESLSLAGTSVNANDLEAVLSLPKLAQLYVWNTDMTQDEKETLSKKFPDVEIIGNLFSDNEILKLDRPRLENDGIVRNGELVSFKHSMPGVAIRFSIDGSEPDSVKSDLFEKAFILEESMVLKAKACKDGWYCSDILTVSCFVEGIAPVEVKLSNPPDKQYPGIGAAGLHDLQKGFADILKEPSWLGFRETPFSAVFDFGKAISVKSLVVSHARNIGGFVFPPQEVQIWAGNSASDMSMIKKMIPVQPSGYATNGVVPLSVPLDAEVPYRYYKLIAKPVAKLPSWHNSKGESGWLFVDEVFFY